ncbi:MAG: gliding motility-associated C-terminal domain-containing protein [Chitinophagaceae bacterium]
MKLHLAHTRGILFLFLSVLLSCVASAQNFSFNCTRDTIIPGCTANPCFTLRSVVPDIFSSSATYTVSKASPSSASSCTPVYFSPASSGTATNLVDDDIYSGVVPIGFNFPFFGNTYSSLVISTNGLISFDLTRANQSSHYGLFNNGGVLVTQAGTPENLPSVLYDPLTIMGVYQDIDVTINSSPNRRIEYTTVGAAPNRKWILTFFEIPLYNCPSSFHNTNQIILNEGTGIIEISVFEKESCATWNFGRAMIGIQDGTRTSAYMPSGRRASDMPWSGTPLNETWRFVPASGASLFKRVELLDLAGNPIPGATPVVNALTDGTREVSFANICPPAGATTSYIVKSVYQKFDNAAVEIAGFDTVRVVRGALTDLGATAASTPSGCGSVGTGSITVQVPAGSGSGNFEYSLTSAGGPWQTNNQFQNLAGGNYTVYVRDGAGCTSTIPVNVSASGNWPVTFTTTPTTCPGAYNGTITVNANGTANTQYQINFGPWQSSNVFTGLPGGTFFINVRDQVSGCVANGLTATVTAGTSTVTGTATATPTSCAGLNNGSITVTATGTGPFQYAINGGAWQTSNTFSNLAPGNYNMTIREAGVCVSAAIPVTVTAGSGLVPVITSAATSCQGVNDGRLSITIPTGTTAPYTIVVDGNTYTTSVSPAIINGLTAGTHSVTVTDNTGCTTASPVSVTIAAGTGFTATASVTPTSCNGLSDGSVMVSPAAPAVSPFTYVLMPGGATQTLSAPATFSGLAPGTYSVQITDANGCRYTVANQVVNAGAGLVATLTAIPASCTGVNNGRIVVNTNGTAPFTFLLNGSITQNSVTNTTTFNNLTPGSYTVMVTDANGCTTPVAVTTTIGTAAGITATASATAVTCAGGNNGSIAVNIANAGVAPYTFVLNNTVTQTGAAGTVFNGLTASTAYTVLVTDAVGCSYTIPAIVVSEPAALQATAAATDVRCNAGTDGQIVITAAGGTGAYSYSLNNGAYQSGSSFTVAAGTHSVRVQDASGCLFTVNNIVVSEPAVLQASVASAGNASCDGGNDGQITVNANGGAGSYTYSLDGNNFQGNNILLAGPGTYTVTVRDANGCTVSAGTATVGLTNNLTLTPMTDPAAICEGRSVQLQVQTNATVFAWTPAASLSNAAISNPIAGPGSTTLYTVQATLGRCSATDDVLVTVLPAPIANAGADVTICFGQSTQLQGSGGIIYTWTPATSLSSTSVSDPVVTSPAQTSTYQLSVTDASNCVSLRPDAVTVTVTPPIKINVSPADTIVYAGAQVPLLARSEATQYTWSPATGLNNPYVANPVLTAPSVGQTLTLQVEGSTAADCRGQAYVTIRVYQGPDIYIPTAFTPNGDGLNDRFMVQPVGVRELKYLRVYNRAGRLIYSSSQLGAGWDGRFQGQDQPAGVYVWQCQGITDDGKLVSRQGTVTLIR